MQDTPPKKAAGLLPLAPTVKNDVFLNVYSPLAQEARIRGMVFVEAVIDEHGNVVQARAVIGHPLLIDAALKAVLRWKI